MSSVLLPVLSPLLQLQIEKLLLLFNSLNMEICVTCRHRADFLGHMKPSDVKGNNSITGPASGNWTLVDEGGEEVRRSIMKPKMNISAQPLSVLYKRMSELILLC